MFPVKGIESIEFAPVGANGTLPTTGWVKVTDIEMGSVSINIPEANRTKVKVEDKPGVWAVIAEEGDGATVVLKSLNLEPTAADLLFKGLTTSTSTNKFEAPIDGATNVQLAFRLTTKPRMGNKMVFVILNGAVTANLQNTITKDGADFLAIGATVEATAVSDAEGAAVAPWYYEKTPVA